LLSPTHGRSASPDKDPLGWGEVKFGMNRKQVVLALDGKAHLEPRRDTPVKLPPLMRTAKIPDLPDAIQTARGIAEQAKKDNEVNTPKTEPAKRLLKLIKPRVWKQSLEANQGDPTQRNTRLMRNRQLTGTLDDLVASQLGEFEFALENDGICTVSIRPQNRRLSPAKWSVANLDKESGEYLAEVVAAIGELSRSLEAEIPAEVPREEDLRLVIAPTKVRGVTLLPSIAFDGDGVAEITLGTPGADNPTTPANPGRFAVHQTICEALEEKYGPPDERNRLADRDQVVWRFPKTVIECWCHRFGVEVNYVMPSARKSSGVDEL
jgi:hypothetical protein